MNSSIVGLLQNDIAVSPTTKGKIEETPSKFAHILKNSIENVNQTQMFSQKKIEALAHGEIENLHEVMVTAQKAAVTLETAVQIQRKAIDAYNEIMRMQV